MDLPSNLDEYIHESIEHSLGLSVSAKTLEQKLLASEEARHQIQDQIFLLQDRLKEKDKKIDRSRAEASMSAQALRKCIDENQKLAAEREDLLSRCIRWEKECALYDHDREALMEFGNEADERAKEAEIRALEAENDCKRLSEELKYYKRECEMHMMNEARTTKELQTLKHRIDELERARLQGFSGSHLDCSRYSLLKENQEESRLLTTVPGDLSGDITMLEGHILESVISSVFAKASTTGQVNDEVEANALSFLEAHMEEEPCQRLLKTIKPLTKYILALAAGFESLQKDKEHLRINLHRAEEEVKVLFEENNMLDKENEKLHRKYTKKGHQGSEGKHSTSVLAKGKRKSNPGITSSTDRVIDFCGAESLRHPLSPVQQNSPDSRMHKK